MNAGHGQPSRRMVVEEYAGDDAAEMLARLQAANRDSRVIADRYDELIAKWPDHFVACKDGTIYVDPDMDGLFRQLTEAGVSPADAIVVVLRTGKYCFSDLA